MSDVVFYYEADEQATNEDAQDGVEEEQVVNFIRSEVDAEQRLDKVDQIFQDDSCESRKNSDQKADEKDEVLFFDRFLPPDEEAVE
jgi:hypothetical protein